jgi:hypothetical protein
MLSKDELMQRRLEIISKKALDKIFKAVKLKFKLSSEQAKIIRSYKFIDYQIHGYLAHFVYPTNATVYITFNKTKFNKRNAEFIKEIRKVYSIALEYLKDPAIGLVYSAKYDGTWKLYIAHQHPFSFRNYGFWFEIDDLGLFFIMTFDDFVDMAINT